jgi:hypothetical protein
MKNNTTTLILLFLVAAITSLTTYFFWIRGADHRDFYPRWAGARLVLSGSNDIYTLEATREIQLSLYGKVIPVDRDQQGFAYPAIILPLLLPFGLINDVEIATALWNGFTVTLMVFGFLLLQSRNATYSKSAIVLSIFWFFTLLTVFQGQITGILIAIFCIGYTALRRERAFLGGIIFSLGFVKPELAFIPILVLLITSVQKRNCSFILGLLAGLLVLLALSFGLLGFWFMDWLEAVIRYSQYAKVVWPLVYAFNLHPGFGFLFLLGIFLIIRWGWKNQEYLFAVSIPLSYLILPQTLVWGLALLLVPINMILSRRTRNPVLLLWFSGWISVFGYRTIADWWNLQGIIFPIAAILIIIYSKIPLPREEINQLQSS